MVDTIARRAAVAFADCRPEVAIPPFGVTPDPLARLIHHPAEGGSVSVATGSRGSHTHVRIAPSEPPKAAYGRNGSPLAPLHSRNDRSRRVCHVDGDSVGIARTPPARTPTPATGGDMEVVAGFGDEHGMRPSPVRMRVDRPCPRPMAGARRRAGAGRASHPRAERRDNAAGRATDAPGPVAESGIERWITATAKLDSIHHRRWHSPPPTRSRYATRPYRRAAPAPPPHASPPRHSAECPAGRQSTATGGRDGACAPGPDFGPPPATPRGVPAAGNVAELVGFATGTPGSPSPSTKRDRARVPTGHDRADITERIAPAPEHRPAGGRGLAR